MLTLIIGTEEVYNEQTEEFEFIGGFDLQLEHSLLSLSKWESRTKKPFLSREEKSVEELMLYVSAMIISPNPPRDVLSLFKQDHIDAVKAYIESSESATTFGTMPKTPGRAETITSELIYYWMFIFNIPIQCESWHLNRLFSLIRIFNIKSQKPKKRTKAEIAMDYRKLNEQRRRELGTNG